MLLFLVLESRVSRMLGMCFTKEQCPWTWQETVTAMSVPQAMEQVLVRQETEVTGPSLSSKSYRSRRTDRHHSTGAGDTDHLSVDKLWSGSAESFPPADFGLRFQP